MFDIRWHTSAPIGHTEEQTETEINTHSHSRFVSAMALGMLELSTPFSYATLKLSLGFD